MHVSQQVQSSVVKRCGSSTEQAGDNIETPLCFNVVCLKFPVVCLVQGSASVKRSRRGGARDTSRKKVQEDVETEGSLFEIVKSGKTALTVGTALLHFQKC